MNSFFVPIFIKTGKLSEEKLLVALIGVTSDFVYFHYSSKRIDFCQKFQGAVFAHTVKKTLDQIQAKVAHVNSELGQFSDPLFGAAHPFSLDYFAYLQKYSQNSILFGGPENFNFAGSTIGFTGLYESLMGEKWLEEKETKLSLQAKVKQKLEAATIQDKVDIDFKISPHQVEGINAGITVSLIGKNGGLLVANALDFHHTPTAIIQALNAFDVLAFSLNKLAESKGFDKSKYTLITTLPDAGSEQEKLFNLVYKNKKGVIELLPEDSVEKLTSLVQSSDYHKFSTLISA